MGLHYPTDLNFQNIIVMREKNKSPRGLVLGTTQHFALSGCSSMGLVLTSILPRHTVPTREILILVRHDGHDIMKGCQWAYNSCLPNRQVVGWESSNRRRMLMGMKLLVDFQLRRIPLI